MIRKANEEEKSHDLRSAKNSFLFYTIALLVCAFVSFINTGDFGWQMTILWGGTAIYWWSKVGLGKKTQDQE